MQFTTKPPPGPATVFHTGWYSYAHPYSGVNTSATWTNGSLRVGPMWVAQPVTLTRIGVEVTSAGDASSTVILGIYADDGTGFPGALLLDSAASGSASTVLANGKIAGDNVSVQEITISVPLTPGRYWVGSVLQGVTVTQPTMRAVVTTTTPWTLPQSTLPATGLVPQISFAQASVTGALPNPMVVASSGTSLAKIFVKAA